MTTPSAPPAPADELDELPELLPEEEDLEALPELIPVSDEETASAAPADPDIDDLPELLPASEDLPELEPVSDEQGADAASFDALPERLPEAGDSEAPEDAAEELDEATIGSYRKLYANTFGGVERDLRIAQAHAATGDVLCALCFDPEPGVILALLENAELKLMHARLIAEHHQNPVGLDALGRRADFARDTMVRRMLMRNIQAPDALLRKVLSQLSLPLLFRANLGHENSERARKVGREVLRQKFMQASSEERVTLILRTEGRCLQVLVGVTFDQKMTSLLCSRSYQSTLLVQSLARFPALPPVLITTLLKQPLVQRSMPLKKLLLQHKNCPSSMKH